MKRGHSPTPLSDTNNKDNNVNEQLVATPSSPPKPSSLPKPPSSPEKERPKQEGRREEDSEKGKEEEALRELDNIVNAFRWYYYYVMQRMDKSVASFNSLPLRHRELVPDFEASILDY